MRERLRKLTPERCVEWFVVADNAFLRVDIAVAHQENRFEHGAEWAPLIFSAAATLLLLPMAFGAGRARARGARSSASSPSLRSPSACSEWSSTSRARSSGSRRSQGGC